MVPLEPIHPIDQADVLAPSDLNLVDAHPPTLVPYPDPNATLSLNLHLFPHPSCHLGLYLYLYL